MKIIVDTNVLLRFLVQSPTETAQNQAAIAVFNSASQIIIPTHVVCELVWVLLSLYKLGKPALSDVIQKLLSEESKLVLQEDEVQAGLNMLNAGGDFADGVNAYTGRLMTRGEAVFVTFDKQAARLLSAQGIRALLL